MSREAYQNIARETIERGDAVIYLYEREFAATGEKIPIAVGFAGKATKPIFNYRYSNEGQRAEHLRKWLKDRAELVAAREAEKAKRKAERDKPCELVVGDILVASWGYDQTNVDFYQVTDLAGRMATLRKIAQQVDASRGGGDMTEYVLPVRDRFIGEPFKKRVSYGDSVTLTSYMGANKWDGRARYQSHYA